MKILKFQKKILKEWLNTDSKNDNGDGLVIVGKGMGVLLLTLGIIQVAASEKSLVLLLNSSVSELDELKLQLDIGKREYVNCVDHMNAGQRVITYSKGGVIGGSSRLFIVDFLNERIPVDLVTGIYILHAHRVKEFSSEAFVLRLYRQKNNRGWIKAISDEPTGFTGGIFKLEKSLRVLYQRHVSLWPRFQVQVKHDIEGREQVEMVELRIPLTKAMKKIQLALWECLELILQELKRNIPVLENEELTTENTLHKNFEFYLKDYLDPSKISNKTRNLLYDIKTIRTLTSYLTGYDCVTFFSFLETLVTASSPTSVFKTDTSQWLMLDAAQVVIQTAKSRVYKKKGEILEPVLEAQPKWKILMDILREITLEKQDLNKTSSKKDGPILIMVQEDRTCYQVSELLGSTGYNIVHHHPHGQHPKIIQTSRSSESDFSSHGIECLFQRIFKNYLRWKGGLIQMKSNISTSQRAETLGATEAQSGIRKSTDHTSKRRRLRGGGNMGERKSKDLVFNIDGDADEIHDLLSQKEFAFEIDKEFTERNVDSSLEVNPDKTIYVRPYSNYYSTVAKNSVDCLFDDGYCLDQIKPRWIIMLDADLSFIRRVELFKASNSHHPLKVFFMVYDNSIEERKYLTEIRKEKEAFEKLINQKGNMVVPINQDGRGMLEDPDETYWHEFDTRMSRNIVTSPEIIVDIREFRSSLPSLIHAKKIMIRPCTLEVGDYILSGSMCVERKSINDLVGSLKSGRLYNQAEAMCIHYAIPILLIEFDPGKSFSFSMIRDDAVASVGTTQKLVLLLIHFPKLRIIWSPTPSFTVEVFEALKNKQDEPCMDTAMAAGVESTAFKDTNFNITPIDILKSLPGITSKNFHYIASQVKNLDELMDMKLQDLQDLIGSEQGKKLFNFINFNISLPDVCTINAS